MRKSILLKLLMLVVCASMVLALFACDGGNTETDPETPKQSEAPTDPEETDPEESTPGESTPDESTPDESTPDESTPDESTPDESTPDESTPAETDPKPTCDGNHDLKAKGDQGHYEVACEICGTQNGTVEAHTFADVEGKPTCTACGHVASCNGAHLYSSNAEVHWISACLACGFEGEAEAEHTPAYADGKYACTVCEYVYTCPTEGVHELVDAGEAGHHTAACVICNAEAGENVPHVYEDKDGSRICACGNEAACKGVHQWTSDADGHQMAACDICGAAATEKVAHNEEKAEFVSDTEYVYGCKDCGYAVYTKTLTDKVAAFITPGDVHYNEMSAEKSDLTSNTKYHIATSLNMTDMPYVTLTHNAADNISQLLWNRHLGDVKDRSEHEEYTFDIGQAKYLVIKARATMAEDAKVNLTLSTVGFEGATTITLPLVKATENAEWVTYVINLEKAFGASYAKAEGADTYAVDTFYFHLQPFTPTDVLDIAYMAFVEGEWADVAANVEEETVVAVTGNNVGNEVNTETGACVGEHLYSAAVVDGVYKSVCVCGATKDSYGVKAEGPNTFWGAESLYGWVGITGTADKEVLYDEDGTGYLRFDNTVVNKANWSAFQLSNGNSAPSGQYMVMKYRIGENGLGQTSLAMYINSKASQAAGATWDKGPVTIKVSEDGQWHYVVIDLANRVKEGAFNAAEDGTYNVNYVQIRYFTGFQTKTEADDYMDVSYIAFCDSIDDVKNIVDVETYEWSVDSSTSAERKTADNTCVVCVYSETVSGTTHTVACSLCGDVVKTYEVPADINYYADLSIMGQYGSTLTKNKYDKEAGLFYNNFTATGGCHFALSGGNGAGTWTTGTYDSGKYLVIKYRSTVKEEMYVGTADKGARTDKNPVRASVGQLLPSDEWKVQVFVIPDDCASYTVNSEQRLYFMVGSSAGSFDVAYLAVVDSVDEAILLLEEEETFYLGNAHLNQKMECVDPCKFVYTEDAAATNGYKYVCEGCGAVNSDINWYRDTFYGGYSSTATKKDGYTTFTFSAGGHLNLSYAGSDTRGGMPSTEQVVAGKYLAIKFRAELSGNLQIRIGNTSSMASNNWNYLMNTVGEIKPAYTSADEWRVLIIDLSDFNDAEYEIGKKHGILLSTQGASGAGVTMDVAWVAVGDSIEEIKTFFTEEDTTYYDFGTSFSNEPVQKNLDGTEYVAPEEDAE